MDELPGYDAWKTHDPRSDSPVYEAQVTVTLSLRSVDDVAKVRELMEAKDFDFEKVTDNDLLPGQPWVEFTKSVEDHPEDFEHRFKTNDIGPEVMSLVEHIEIEHTLPDLDPPEPDRDDLGF